MFDPRSLMLVLYTLIALLLLGVVFFLVAVVGQTGVRLLIWRSQKAKAEREDHEAKYRADGTAYPPFSRGLCDSCQRAFEKVYYLPSGKRLCEHCYKEV